MIARIGIFAWCYIFFLSYSIISANVTHTFEGKVINRLSRQPVAGAAVTMKSRSVVTITDIDGMFAFPQITKGEYDLKISIIGYDDLVAAVKFDGATTGINTFYLVPTSIPCDNITVTATRFNEDPFNIPKGISITPKHEFTERNFSSSAEILREEPGILVQKTTHGHGAPIIRGLIGKYVLLLYDGIRLNKPTFRFGANQYFNTVDIGSYDKIEVVRGPSSVAYGSDAIGGTINLIPETKVYNDSLLALSSSFITRYSRADNGKSIYGTISCGNNKISATLNGSLKDIDDLHAGGDIGKQRPTSWDENNYGLRSSYNIDLNNSLSLAYLAVRQSEIPRYDKYISGEFSKYIYDPQDRDIVAISFSSKKLGSLFNSFKLGLSYQNENEGRSMQKSGSDYISRANDKVTTLDGYWQLSSMIKPGHWLSFGSEYYQDRVKSRLQGFIDDEIENLRPTYPDNSYYHSAGIFIQDEYSIRDGINVNTGIRYSYFKIDSPLEVPFDHYRETYQNLTGTFSFNYLVSPSVNIICGWSRGFRAPNLNDTVVLKYSSSGVDAPSFDLNPEISDNIEAGCEIKSCRYSGGLYIYYNNLRGLIDRKPGTYNGLSYYDENNNGVQDQDEYNVYQKFNVDNAAIYGFELDGHVEISDRWLTRFNCFWTRGDNYSQNEPMSRIPPLMGLVALKFFPDNRIWLEAYTRLAGPQRRLSNRDRDDNRIDPDGTPGWTTFNLKAQLVFSYITFNILLENLTDSGYKEHGSGIYSTGRNIIISLTFKSS